MGRGWKRARELSTAPVPYPTGQSPRREGHSGRRTSSVVEHYFGAQTTSPGCRRLQRSVAGFPPSLRCGAWRSLRPTPQVAAKGQAAFRLRSDHSATQRNDAAAPVTRSARLRNNRSSPGSRCCRLKQCRNSRDPFSTGPAGRKAGLRPGLAAHSMGELCCEVLTQNISF